MQSILQELSSSGLVKVTGSYADGTQTEDSDIDFQVKIPRETKLYNIRNSNFPKLLDIMKRHNIVVFGMPYGFSTIHPNRSELSNINRPKDFIHMEFADVFRPRKNKLKEVEILGIKFKTY